MDENIICPICQEKEGAAYGIDYQGHRIVKCKTCSLRYVSPRKSKEELQSFYDEEYLDNFQTYEAETIKFTWFRTLVTDRLHTLKFMLKFLPYPKSMLDVGAGNGLLLVLARQMGFSEVVASDITNVNQGFFKNIGMPFVKEDFTGAELSGDALKTLGGKKFDIVSSVQVLEHVMDPNIFLHHMKELVKKDGLIYIQIPNEGNFQSVIRCGLSRLRLYPKPFKNLSAFHHLFFYTKKTLTKLLEKNGLEVIHLTTYTRFKLKNPGSWGGYFLFPALGHGNLLEVVCRPKT